MPTRKNFIKTAGLLTSTSIVGVSISANNIFADSGKDYNSKRPKLSERKFISNAVEETIKKVKSSILEEELVWMFENCFPNTLDTTVRFGKRNGKPDTFIITGDINAMWLRDSTAQVWPCFPLASKDEKLLK